MWNVADKQIPAREAVTVQLLGREDLTVDDAKTAQERWKQYIDSYVLVRLALVLPRSLACFQRSSPY